MALRAPNPLLATEQVTLTIRAKVNDNSGGQSLAGSSGTTYPAIVTLQKVNTEGLRDRAGTTLAKALWDVIIFSPTDPLVTPQLTLLAVVGQNRTLIATERSTYREPGAWYVLCMTLE